VLYAFGNVTKYFKPNRGLLCYDTVFTLKTETARSSETSVFYHVPSRRHSPEDRDLKPSLPWKPQVYNISMFLKVSHFTHYNFVIIARDIFQKVKRKAYPMYEAMKRIWQWIHTCLLVWRSSL